MIQKKITYILTILTFLISDGIFAQQFKLKITSKIDSERVALEKIDFVKSHFNETSIKNEINRISEKLKWIGYFSNQVENIHIKDSLYIAQFSLGKSLKKVTLFIPLKLQNLISANKLKLNTEEAPAFLTSISNKLDRAGQSFSEVRLSNINIENNQLSASIKVTTSKKRTIDKVIIKGYNNFSKSHVKHFLGLKVNSIFNQKKLKRASQAIQSLNFVTEIKPPEVLFSKDSTIIYVYLKKNKASNFDGLLNFTSKENGSGLLFNGHININLKNTLNTGEEFNLSWRANGEEREDFKINTKIPYIFNTPLSPELSFDIYRQDSTFLNTNFTGELNFDLSPRSSVSLSYNSKTSINTLKNEVNNSISDFESSFIGLQFKYKIPALNNFNEDKLYLKFHPSLGFRTSNNQKQNQFKIDFAIRYLYYLNYRNSIFIQNETGFLNSKSLLKNEMYRIGGMNSIRGFNEQSIFTQQYSYFNIEYRYLTSQTSYLYSITDFGKIKINSSFKNIYGLGIGYLFKMKNSQLNLGYVVGLKNSQSFDFKNTKLSFSWINFF